MPTPIARKAVSLRHIAEAAEVSLATASMALSNHPHVSEATKTKVREAAEAAGYIRKPRKPSRRTANNAVKPSRVGFLLLGSPVDDDLQLGYLHSLCLRASDIGARVDIQALEDVSDPARTSRTVQEFCRGINGLILSGLVNRQVLEVLTKINVPYVILGGTMDSFQANGSGNGQIISYNVEAMSEMAVSWHLKDGHKRIGFVVERLPPGLWNDRWLRGYQLAHLEHKLEINPKYICITGQVRGSAQSAVEGFLALPKPPTAYIIPDARVAASFLTHMQNAGQTPRPETVLISGYPSVVARYNVQHLPWMGSDIDHITTLAIRQIQQLIAQPLPCPTELILPFNKRNMP
jgi:LacI family transcriptional regulator